MRWFRLATMMALALLLTSAAACTQAPPPPAPDTSTSSTSAAPERVNLAAGSRVTMRNGLTLTIPSGWVGVLKNSASDSDAVMGALGRRVATQSLRLRRTDGTGEFKHISLSSAVESEVSGSGLTRVGDLGDVTLYRTSGKDSDAPTLLVAQTHLPGEQYGAVLFRGTASEGEDAVREIWRLLQIEGAELEEGSEVAYR